MRTDNLKEEFPYYGMKIKGEVKDWYIEMTYGSSYKGNI